MSIEINLMEYKGINAPKCGFEDVITFKEFSTSEMLELPFDISNISSFLKTSVDVQILDEKIFKTPKGISVEGQSLTGLKLGVEGEIKTVITYISNIDNQSINALTYRSKFYISTPIPDTLVFNQHLGVNVYTESINIQKLGNEMLSESLVLLLTVE